MKLTSAQIDRTLSQFEAQAIPDNHPAMPQLSSQFGEHTFFLDNDGLDIVEPCVSPGAGTEAATVVKIASWKDSERTSLVAHKPKSTDVVVLIGPAEARANGP